MPQIMVGGWSILHQRSLPRPLAFRMISGTITYKVFLTCPHHLSLGFLITPHPSSPLSVHHPCRNPIGLGMMTQPLTISVFLPCQCSHLLIFHIIIPRPLSPLSRHRQFWNLSIHQHPVPPRMSPILLPHRFSLLIFNHIIPRRFSLLRFVQSNLLLPSSPPFMPQKMRRVIHRRRIAILHRPILPPLLITLITTTGITSQKFDLSIHHQV
jgi:hypothetical protein